jgi:hypothetical protein
MFVGLTTIGALTVVDLLLNSRSRANLKIGGKYSYIES